MEFKQHIEALQQLLPVGTLICIKDTSGKVLAQNTHCESFCGKQVGIVCRKHCMALFDELQLGTPSETQIKEKQDYEGKPFDIILTANQNYVVSLLFPRDKDLSERIGSFDSYGLTSQELLIATLVLQGLTNSEIMKKLFISHPTLRTHLRAIYQKLPEDIFPRRS